MKNETYLYFTETAIQKEKEEKYDLAALYWGKAKYLAADLKTRLWAQYHQENNEERHSLHNSYRGALRTQKENQRMASAFKRYINKQAANDDCIRTSKAISTDFRTPRLLSPCCQ
ncbi:hypothetical protein [Xenorhabdus bovienii]|uniref:ANR family transcriptional regulator n=1 Tax=Xenorhabdus bovienii str. puntauvense TaxID=1398201 RepID=A0A077NJ04_XENBV|nr:hypothetical protein [Xenorhabdus bovienii]CDG90441.1 conserved hypothetical protein [Xenorhabdus bovienii str. feltiae France]CDG91591.1 conserved hypothetical protein [Xenorhabdus bovienii str. feltiae Florida]CDG98433.1 conserved hypothetical protein [Xenorhabdus bovienii str. puntauvense]